MSREKIGVGWAVTLSLPGEKVTRWLNGGGGYVASPMGREVFETRDDARDEAEKWGAFDTKIVKVTFFRTSVAGERQ